MKIRIQTILTSLLLCSLAFGARATILFQDNFSYPAGTLTNGYWVAGAGSTLNATISVTSTNTVSVGYGATTSDQPRAFFTNGFAPYSISAGSVINSTNAAYYFPSNTTAAAALYTAFTINFSGSEGATKGTYIAYLCDTNFNFIGRLYTTNGPGGSGYQLDLQPGGSTYITNVLNGINLMNPVVLSPNQNYNVVMRYILGSASSNAGLETLWINPTSESGLTNANSITVNAENCVNPYYTNGFPGLAGFGLRNTSGIGQFVIGNLVVGTTFKDVVPSSAGSNPPFITVEPQNNTSLFAGGSFSDTVVAGGDPANYQWYFISNSITYGVNGGTAATLQLNSITTNLSGMYFVTVTNLSGAVTSSVVNVQISPVPVPPVVTSPAAAYSLTNNEGDSVSFPVTATGIPTPAYKWYVITTNNLNMAVTNPAAGPNISGTNSSTLSISPLTNTEAGVYFVTVTNLVGTNTSPLITLVVNPLQLVNISSIISIAAASPYDVPTNTTSLYEIQGIVTTWTNMTSSGSSEFYMQDGTAGIVVFWDDAPSKTNLPPAGAKVQVIAPLSSFNGLLEIEPVFGKSQQSVTIISTNNPLPTPQALPFDPNILNNDAQMFAMGGSYFVASNVTLSTTPVTYQNINDTITNNAYNVLTDPLFGNLMFTNEAAETYVIYFNNYIGLVGNTKPTGPVTIKGVLGYYDNGANYPGGQPSGWEFTPTRPSDIITYVNVTNVLSHLVRQGDLVTNTFNQSVLRPGETLTAYVSIADPEGGAVTLSPSYIGLPADATWTPPISGPAGQPATTVFQFSPVTADAASNYVVSIGVTSTTGNNYTYTFSVYVPNANEEQVYLSEVFANPTTNSSSPAYNPLDRPAESTETNITINDQYVEIANLSPSSTVNLQNWELGNGSSILHTFNQDDSSEQILPQSAFVVYGGLSDGSDSTPGILGGYNNSGQIEPVNPLESLSLSTNGGVLALYNNKGYLIDRVAYPASALNTSFSRFPTLNSGMVPQQFISTNYTTAGLQYDGGAWTSPTKVPTGVTNVTVAVQGGTNVIFGFPVNSSQAYTIWGSGNLLNPFSVQYGQGNFAYPGTAKITNSTVGPVQFYYMTTQ